jgi:hypothetical protein
MKLAEGGGSDGVDRFVSNFFLVHFWVASSAQAGVRCSDVI